MQPNTSQFNWNTVDEFANSIKAKHPEYADKDNADLANRYLEKHPVYRKQIKAYAPPPAPAPKLKGMDLFANTPEAAKQRGEMKLPGSEAVKEAFQGGVQQAKEGYQQASTTKNLLQLLEGSVKMGAGVVGAAFSPLAAVTKPTIGAVVDAVSNNVVDGKGISDIPAVQRFANSKAGEVTTRAVEDVNNLNTIAGAVAGGVNPKATAKAVSDTAGSIYKAPPKAPPASPASIAATTAKNVAKSDAKISDLYNRSIKPTVAGKKTASQNAKASSNVISGLKAVAENKPNLTFKGADGETITGGTPKTVDQLSQSIEQTKGSIFKKYDALAKQAGEQGITIETPRIASELDPVINSKSLTIANPKAVAYAKSLQERLSSAGKIDAETAQEVIKHYNESLQAFYKNPTYDTASAAGIDALIVNKFREALDEGISGVTGEGYQALKNQYGALSAMEKDVAHRATVWGRQNPVGFMGNIANIASGAELARGLLTLSPSGLVSSAAIKGIQMYMKYLNNPDVGVAKIFSEIEKSNLSSKGSTLGSEGSKIK